jgi:hypothetical protein
MSQKQQQQEEQQGQQQEQAQHAQQQEPQQQRQSAARWTRHPAPFEAAKLYGLVRYPEAEELLDGMPPERLAQLFPGVRIEEPAHLRRAPWTVALQDEQGGGLVMRRNTRLAPREQHYVFTATVTAKKVDGPWWPRRGPGTCAFGFRCRHIGCPPWRTATQGQKLTQNHTVDAPCPNMLPTSPFCLQTVRATGRQRRPRDLHIGFVPQVEGRPEPRLLPGADAGGPPQRGKRRHGRAWPLAGWGAAPAAKRP